MVDIYPSNKRREIMRRVKQRRTGPEEVMAKVLQQLNVRFRRNDKRLSGKPDFVIPTKRAVIFVHGCFWHRHAGCSRTTTPATNIKFWKTKFHNNVRRDRRNQRSLRKAGWRVAIVWECSLRKPERVRKRMARFLKLS